MNHRALLTVLIVLAIPANARAQAAKPVPVTLEKTADGYRLLRDGKPFFIKGAGGSGPLDRLKAAGANSNRTWGADNLGPMLDEAQKLGLTITVGIWLGHEEHGFSYNNANQVADQVAQVRKSVEQYKNHPAVLMWALGNEMEGYGAGDNAAIWSAINNLAVMVKRLDPNHPVMTVISEIGGDRVKNINRLCPDVDIVGINSYGGGPSIPERYKAAGGTKPYVLTEYGPGGTWETGKTAWGAAQELTSTQKAEAYRRTYTQAIVNRPLSLGGYAFTWGFKQEATATWFGMLLSDGSNLGVVDTMTELWSGKPPANRCPVINSLKLDGPDQVDPGATVHASFNVTDPDGDPLQVTWVLQPEADRYNLGGSSERALPTYPEAIVKSGKDGADVKLPAEAGGYRLFAYARDGKGNAAVGNIPLLVKGEIKPVAATAAKLPFTVYSDQGQGDAVYVPTGWMGNIKALKLDEGCKIQPHSGTTCIQCDYSAGNDWAGVVWQSPANDWGDLPGGRNLNGAKRLTFWARGDKGTETVTFLIGLIGADSKYPDTAQAKLETKLTTAWQQFSMDLTGKDLTRVKTGFAFTVAGQGRPVTFYLDDIRYE
ncbi:MAG TPA: glycoside hydrolase family 2 TIM barrel-domain containing protein [Armatimonadota bacterium]|jgi:hypothetical protein